MEGKTRVDRRFIEGKGWEVKEVPVDAPATPGAVHVKPQAKLASLPDILKAAAVEQLSEELSLRGFVVLAGDDHAELLERISELERQLDHLAQGGTLPDALPPVPNNEKQPATVITGDLKTRIGAAATLDELTELMKDVTDKKLLTLADKQAEKIKGGEA